jgi:ribonuclease P/MRP protein subunit POP5
MVRLKHRYLLVQILSPSPPETPSSSTNKPRLPNAVVFHAPTPPHITASTILHLLRTQVSLLFGDYGSGALASGLAVKYFSNATSTAIVRCPRAHYRLAWAALTCLTEMPSVRRGLGGGERCVFRVVRVSGMTRKVEEEAVRRSRRMICAGLGEDGGDGTLRAILDGDGSGGGGGLRGGDREREMVDVNEEEVETSDEG